MATRREELGEVPKPVEKNRFSIVDIPTQTTPVFRDNETGEDFDLMEGIRRLLEAVSELRRRV